MQAQINLDKIDCKDIPLPIVSLNRWTLLSGVVLAIVLQQPLVTTLLFLILLPAVVLGQRYSLIFQVGKRVLARQILQAETEDRRLMRFNNGIALTLFGLAQLAFGLGFTLAGYILAGIVAFAAAVALAGFCFGCFLYYQFRLNRYRFLGQ